MADEIEALAEWIEELRALLHQLAHIPYAARHQAEIAQLRAKKIEAAYLADELPERIAALWAQHRPAVNQALTRAVQQADQWDADFPVFKTRPVSE